MSTALYRRYRPESFADVIGQEHVTQPLMQALRTGRTNHAYLFSGPRGCGKTTSARILARCLNCEQGPTPTPCGQCASCVALARGGSGSVDVIEIDAASHGGVDDARDLREKASYGPAQSRYKVYIIDEAHMVTPQGFNALLKIVEEPPEHVKFIFATTEPEKVIGTIRSRTHHYPFRLVPPARLQEYLEQLCAQEGVAVEPGVLSFVIRAGGGSVRDSLSVLDQLIAGSDDVGLTYAGAAALLGFTEGELLDATVDAFAARDGAAVFRQVDRIIETGQDPRRFVEDLLERLRDLIVVAALNSAGGDGTSAIFRGLPQDQLDRMQQQAAAFGPGELSYAADAVNAGLTEMTGATSPRLQLELICARLLLPRSAGEHGFAARIDRIEHRLEMAGPQPPAPRGRSLAPAVGETTANSSAQQGDQGARASRSDVRRPDETRPPQPAPAAGAVGQGPRADEAGIDAAGGAAAGGSWASTSTEADAAASGVAGVASHAGSASGPGGEPESRGEAGRGRESASPGRQVRDGHERSQTHDVSHPTADPAVPVGQDDAPIQVGGRPGGEGGSGADGSAPDAPARGVRGGLDTDALRRAWPDVLAKVFGIRRVTWTFLSEHAQVLDYDGERLLVGIATRGLAQTFRNGHHAEVVRQALIDARGIDTRVEGVALDDAPAVGARPGGPAGRGGTGPQGGAASAPPASGDRRAHDPGRPSGHGGRSDGRAPASSSGAGAGGSEAAPRDDDPAGVAPTGEKAAAIHSAPDPQVGDLTSGTAAVGDTPGATSGRASGVAAANAAPGVGAHDSSAGAHGAGAVATDAAAPAPRGTARVGDRGRSFPPDLDEPPFDDDVPPEDDGWGPPAPRHTQPAGSPRPSRVDAPSSASPPAGLPAREAATTPAGAPTADTGPAAPVNTARPASTTPDARSAPVATASETPGAPPVPPSATSGPVATSDPNPVAPANPSTSEAAAPVRDAPATPPDAPTTAPDAQPSSAAQAGPLGADRGVARTERIPSQHEGPARADRPGPPASPAGGGGARGIEAFRAARRAQRDRTAAPGNDAAAAPAPLAADDLAARDDEDITDLSAVGQPVIAAVLGGTVIAEHEE